MEKKINKAIIPYENGEEVRKDRELHGPLIYFSNNKKNKELIYCIEENCVSIINNDGAYRVGFDSLAVRYTWQDGTPCGK